MLVLPDRGIYRLRPSLNVQVVQHDPLERRVVGVLDVLQRLEVHADAVHEPLDVSVLHPVAGKRRRTCR